MKLIQINDTLYIVEGESGNKYRVSEQSVIPIQTEAGYIYAKTKELTLRGFYDEVCKGIDLTDIEYRITRYNTDIGNGEVEMQWHLLPEKEAKLIVGEDMICPITKKHCDDECCPVGAQCNLGSKDVLAPEKEAAQIHTQDWSSHQNKTERYKRSICIMGVHYYPSEEIERAIEAACPETIISPSKVSRFKTNIINNLTK
jgi:hypothetical protein